MWRNVTKMDASGKLEFICRTRAAQAGIKIYETKNVLSMR